MNIVSTNKLLFDIEFNDKNCDSILIEKLPNDDTMRIVVARGHHILSSDEIKGSGKKITVNLEDMANCVSVSGNQKMIDN